ncbi:hypothetical protein Dimus_039044 [Dionaea muscipula]
MHLLMQLFKVEMKQGESVQAYVDRFSHAVRKLTNTGFQLDDEMKVALLLARLAFAYSLVRDQILHSMQTVDYKKIMEQLISRDVVAKIIAEEFSSQSSDQNLFVRGRQMGDSHGSGSGKKRGKSRRRSASRNRDLSKVQCYYCKDFGHIKLQCPKLKNKDKGKASDDGKDKQRNVAVVEDTGGDDSDADLMIATQGPDLIQCRTGYATPTIEDDVVDFRTGWILDSGCSFHMTPHREWFRSYRVVPDDASIFMGNDSVCRVVVVVTVRVKMFDEAVMDLAYIRHVLGLKKNLLCLGTLDDLGYRISSQGGVYKFSLGSRVQLKGRKIRDLYHLVGSTVVDSGFVVVSSLTAYDASVF